MTTAPALPSRPRASLRISRRDVVNQIIANARAENSKAIEDAKKRRDVACQAFADAMCAEAMRLAGPAIDALNKVSSRRASYRAAFKFEPTLREDANGAMAFEGKSPVMDVPIFDKEQDKHWDRDYNRFTIEVKLTKELHALRDAAVAVLIELAELYKINRATQRELAARVSRKLLNQAIKELPEGEALLELMNDLRKRVEKETGKHLLLGE